MDEAKRGESVVWKHCGRAYMEDIRWYKEIMYVFFVYSPLPNCRGGGGGRGGGGSTKLKWVAFSENNRPKTKNCTTRSYKILQKPESSQTNFAKHFQGVISSEQMACDARRHYFTSIPVQNIVTAIFILHNYLQQRQSLFPLQNQNGNVNRNTKEVTKIFFDLMKCGLHGNGSTDEKTTMYTYLTLFVTTATMTTIYFLFKLLVIP